MAPPTSSQNVIFCISLLVCVGVWQWRSNLQEFLEGLESWSKPSLKDITVATRIANTNATNFVNITDDWLDQCVADLSQDPWAHQPFPTPPRFINYRLGDCIKFCTREACRSGPIQPLWFLRKNSMARAYEQLACPHGQTSGHVLGGNLTLVQQMLQTFEQDQPQRFVQPPTDALVIHLRLGNVIEDNGHVMGVAQETSLEAPQLLSQGGNPYHTASFRSSIKSFYEYLQDVQSLQNETKLGSIILVGGSHFPLMFRKSRLYAGCLERALREATNLPVTLQIGGDPDADFYYMTNAKYLSVSAGGYSRLIGDMVKSMGGQVIGRTFHDTKEIQATEKELKQKSEELKQSSLWEQVQQKLVSYALALVGK